MSRDKSRRPPPGRSPGQSRPRPPARGKPDPRISGKRGDKPKDKPGERPASGRSGSGRPPRYSHRSDDGRIVLFGFHAVDAALANDARQIDRLRLTENAETRLADAIQRRGLQAERVAPKDLDRLLGPDTVHQGIALDTRALPEPSLDDLAEAAAQDGSKGPLIVLDQVTDPHNVGAILRSAAVFGASGLIMTRRNSPPLAGTMAKSASGGLEHVPVALVPNLARALVELQECGVHVIGLDGDAPVMLEDAPFDGPVALVLGAEGAGLRRLTREHCDLLCRINAPGPLSSLNVSNAAAVSLHLAALRRRGT